MWIARDEDGCLWLYEQKSIGKDSYRWFMVPNSKNERIDDNWFPEVKWSDPEPRELVLKPINKKMDMKLAITIKKPCHPKCLYELTGDVYTTTKTYLIELGNLPKEVVNAINEAENEGCVSSISFVEEKQP